MDSEKLDDLRRAVLAEEEGSAVLSTAPPMLDIRTLNQGWLALPYETLRRVEYREDQSPPLRVYFSSHVLELDGRNLQALYRLLISKRLDQLREIGERHDVAGQDDPVVHSLKIHSKPQKSQGPSRGGRSQADRPGLWSQGDREAQP